MDSRFRRNDDWLSGFVKLDLRVFDTDRGPLRDCFPGDAWALQGSKQWPLPSESTRALSNDKSLFP